MVGAVAGLQEHLKLAREYALESLYDTSVIFFDGAIAQINKHLSTLDDPLVRNKWMKCKNDLSEEIEIIKQLDAERQAFKEVPGTVRSTSPPLPSKSYMFQPVDEFASYSSGSLDDPDVWRPPSRDPQQQYGSRRPTRAGQMAAAQSRKDSSWPRNSSRTGDMKSTGGVGRGAKANAASTSGRAGAGVRATGSSGQQGKKGTGGRSTPNKRDSLVLF